MWLGLALGACGCLGGTQSQAVSPQQALQQAKTDAAEKRWPAARSSASAFWAANCKSSVRSIDDCNSAQLLRGEADLATEAPETALLAFDWAIAHSDPPLRDQALDGSARAKAAIEALLAQHPDATWLVVEQDFDDNYKFGPERAAYTLDGQPLGEVTRRTTFAEREHRVLAQPVAPGHHVLAVEIHWHGQGTFDNYLWSSYTKLELDAPPGGAVVASLDVTYTDGGPSNNSTRQLLHASNLPR